MTIGVSPPTTLALWPSRLRAVLNRASLHNVAVLCVAVCRPPKGDRESESEREGERECVCVCVLYTVCEEEEEEEAKRHREMFSSL